MTALEIFARVEKNFRLYIKYMPSKIAIELFSIGRAFFINRFAYDIPQNKIILSEEHKRKFWDIEFNCNIMNAAGMFKHGRGYEVVARQGAGAWLVGTTTATNRKGNIVTFNEKNIINNNLDKSQIKGIKVRHPFTDYTLSGATSNYMGLPNESHAEIAKRISNIDKIKGCPIGASLSASPDQSGIIALKGLLDGLLLYDRAGVDFIEINESCPNTEKGVIPCQINNNIANLDSELIERLSYISDNYLKKRMRNLPVIVKFSNDTDIKLLPKLIDLLVSLDYDGINLGNTSTDYEYYRNKISEKELKLFDLFVNSFGGGLSGNILKERSLAVSKEAVSIINKMQLQKEFHVIRTGGIDSINDINESEKNGIALNQWFSGYFANFSKFGHKLYKELLFLVIFFSLICFNTTSSFSGGNDANSNEIKSLIKKGEHLYIVDSSGAGIKYVTNALKLSEQTNNDKLKIDALNTIGMLYSYKDKKQSKNYFLDALKYSDKINYREGKGIATFNLGFYEMNHDLNLALNYFNNALNIGKSINSDLISSLALSNIGEVYANLGKYGESIKYFIESSRHFDNLLLRDSSEINLYNYSQLLNSFGIAYKNLDKFDDAKKYYRKYLDLSIKLNERWGIAIAYNNIGIIFKNKNEYDSALVYYIKANKIFGMLNNPVLVANNVLNIGNVYSLLNDFEQAKTYINQSYTIFECLEKTNDIDSLEILQGKILAKVSLADLYFSQKNYKNSINEYFASLKLSEKCRNVRNLRNIYEGLTNCYDSLHDFKNSLVYLKKFMEIKDSVSSEEKSNEIGIMQANYDFEKKLAEQKRIADENQRIESENEDRRNMLQNSGIFVGIIFLFLLAFFTGKFNISIRVAEAIVFITFILFFEFISVLINPIIDRVTNDVPITMLAINFTIALMIFPLHSFFEEHLKKIILKNRKLKKEEQ